jgi:hypothetical protein
MHHHFNALHMELPFLKKKKMELPLIVKSQNKKQGITAR